eukprot:3062647-Rhodomonas_salina.1
MDSGLAEVLARRRQQTEDSQNAGVSMIEPGSGGSAFSPRKNLTGEAPRSAPKSGSAAATGAGMVALALGNEGLRKASEESSVGTGGQFARPTPAQMLKGMAANKSPPKPKAPVQTVES